MEAPAKILVVESEGTDRFASIALSECEWCVHCVIDGIDAVRAFESLNPSLLVLELNTFSLNRVCYWDEIRAVVGNGLRRQPMVVLFPSQSYSDEVAALDDGADDFLRKPISDKVLVARVRRLLRSATHIAA